MTNPKVFTTTLALLTLINLAIVPSTFANTKVAMCQDGHTLSVDDSAVAGLERAGATLGACSFVSVPEFGVIPGIVAVLISAGAFLVIKKKSY